MASSKKLFDAAVRELTRSGAPFELAERNIDGVVHRVYANAPRTLADVYADAAAHADREFLVYEGERWSFASVLKQAAELASVLASRYGIATGQRVAIAMRNYPEWMSAFVAITSVGAVAVPLNSWGQARELVFALDDAEAGVVICDQQRVELLADRLAEGGLHAIVARPGAHRLPANAVGLPDLLADNAGQRLPAAEIQPEDPAMIMYTSGTTGRPKGALSTHRAICQAIVNFECMAAASAMINPEAIGAMLSKGFEPVQMLAVPLFHVSGCHAVFLTALRAGRKLAMMYKWDVERALQLIEQERVTILNAAPAMLLQLLESPLFARADTSSLSSLGAGGAATPARALRLMVEKVPDGYFGTGWGLTETNAIGTAFTGAPFRERPGSAGFMHPTVSIRVCGEDGEELPTGTPGRLWIRTPTMAREYWRRPEATAAEFRDGWFDSGDIGYFDADGYLFLSDRAKDLVIRGGENIYPAEIEEALLDHPGISEAAAFGVPDATLGEQLAVAVVESVAGALSEESIRAFAAERLARFKVPQHVWIRDDVLPRNAAGKILKADLRSAYLSSPSRHIAPRAAGG